MNRKGIGEVVVVLLAMVSSILSAIYATIWLWHEVVLVTMVLTVLVTFFAVHTIIKEKWVVDWKSLPRKYWYLLPFIGYSFVSVFWSYHVDITIYRWVILVCTVILGWYFGQRYGKEQFVSYILAFAVLMLMMTIFVTARDAVVEGEITSRIRGFFWQKNHTALFHALISFLCLMTAIKHRDSRNFAYYGSIVLYLISIGLIVWADSASAVFTTLILHGMVMVLLLWLRYKGEMKQWHYIALGALAVLMLVVVAANLGTIFRIFGRNPNLTGRLPMWRQVYLLYFLKRPWFGYGFNAFWYQTSHRLVIGTVSKLPPIIIADNGFFDLLISNGIVGFSLFLLLYVALWIEPIRALWRAKNIFDCVPFLVMLMIFFGNLTWSMLFENESFYLLLMLTMHFLLTKDKHREQFSTTA